METESNTRVAQSVQDGYDKKEKRFEKAVSRIESKYRMKEFEVAIEKVHKKLHTPGWFQSTEEVLAAIILVAEGVKARHQVKIGKYRVDFVLTEENVILEIDGKIYHTKGKDTKRDTWISQWVDQKWEIIRIPTSLLNKNPMMLVEAIRAIKEKRRIHKQNLEQKALLYRGWF